MEAIAHFTPEELPVTLTVLLVGVLLGSGLGIGLTRRSRQSRRR